MSKNNAATSGNVTGDEIISFLKRSSSYPGQTNAVDAISTHHSWVFLTDEYVYKFKKPYPYDDNRMTTPHRRLKACKEEVKLNKRLAGDVYLGVVAISVNENGNLTLGKGRKTVDWLVKMKRLPGDKMLGYLIAKDESVTSEQLKPAAELLSRFYNNTDRLAITFEEYFEMMLNSVISYRDKLLSPDFNLSRDMIRDLGNLLIDYLGGHRTDFKKRVNDQKIVEGHGDLKPDHICLSPPAIIDCLEFDRKLRILDILDDLAFLSLECDRLEAPWIGEYFIKFYSLRSGDKPPRGLIQFYKSHRALSRAFLTIRHIREEIYRDNPKWEKKTLEYLGLAKRYITSSI